MPRHSHSTHRESGFTLIEVMVVIFIVGIISAIAIPSYRDHIRRSNYLDGQNALQSLMFDQERYRNNTRSYTDDLTNLGHSATAKSEVGMYNLKADNCRGQSGAAAIRSCVLLRAAPNNMARAGDAIFYLDSSGWRGHQATTGGSYIDGWDVD